jgi:hypothetical protein
VGVDDEFREGTQWPDEVVALSDVLSTLDFTLRLFEMPSESSEHRSDVI